MPASYASSASLNNCTLVMPQTCVQCLLPPGVGRISQISFTVFDQTAVFAPSSMYYDRPVIQSTSPSPFVLNTDMSTVLSLIGSGFGSSTRDVTVWVLANTSQICGFTGFLSLPAAQMFIQNDGLLSVQFAALPFVFPNGLLYAAVSDQIAAQSFNVSIAAPAILSLSFSYERPNASLYYIDIVGSNFGPVLDTTTIASSCVPQGVVITIDGVRCVTLTMTVVSVTNILSCLVWI